MNVSDRYNAFQNEAVQNVVADFKEDPKGRFLLVIPTGGGKTTTAVKAVSGLYAEGVLQANEEILWLVHRDELEAQALASFRRFSEESNQPWLVARVHVKKLAGVPKFLADYPAVRFAVIDEAHHAAANSYQLLFQRPNFGILGLTATPSRHDARPLQFSKESYSIGFPDLVQMGVLLRPTVIRVDGGKYEIDDIGYDSQSLEALNNTERNSRIVSALSEHKSILHKIIVYAGTRQHAKDIYELLCNSSLASNYEAISLILGNERRRYCTKTRAEITNETRPDFIQTQKDFTRSIIVNVDVLTEGYDDPTVNAIVMARPTNSKLVYMQALGRGVRIDPSNEFKEAFVIEVDDVLPNITYRIDNRWLYSDISDLLEPAVKDMYFTSKEDLHNVIVKLFDDYNTPQRYRIIPHFSDRDRLTVLLLKFYQGQNKYGHLPLVISNSTRQAAAGFFNFLADRMAQINGCDIEQSINPVRSQMEQFVLLKDSTERELLVHAMENAWALVSSGHNACSALAKHGHPWISFVAFRRRMAENQLSEDLLEFTEDMQNKLTIRESLLTDSIDRDFYLVKFPLPLWGSWGVFVPPAEFSEIDKAIYRLSVIAESEDSTNQWHAAMAVIGTTTASVEQRHIQSLTTIVRERLDFFRRVGDSKKGSAE